MLHFCTQLFNFLVKREETVWRFFLFWFLFGEAYLSENDLFWVIECFFLVTLLNWLWARKDLEKLDRRFAQFFQFGRQFLTFFKSILSSWNLKKSSWSFLGYSFNSGEIFCILQYSTEIFFSVHSLKSYITHYDKPIRFQSPTGRCQ